MGFADFDIMGKCKKILSKMDLLREDIGNAITPIVGALGTTADAGGTESSGTLNAKLNSLITSLGAIRSYTATNNTASATGTLSQKQTYTNSTLIGSTNATGGTATSGTAMAKLNTLLKKELSNITFSIFEHQASTEEGKERTVITLNNILLYGASVYYFADSSSHYAYAYLTIDGVKLNDSVGGRDRDAYTDLKTYPDAMGIKFSREMTNDSGDYLSLGEPIYAKSLTLSVRTSSTVAKLAYITARLAYKQL